MTEILLVRHAQASFDADHYDELSSLGRLQADRLGHFLKDEPVDILISGQLKRQLDTAEAILGYQGALPQVCREPAWDEFDHREIFFKHRPDLLDPEARAQWKIAQGTAYDQGVMALYQAALKRWMSGAEGYPESWSGFCERVETAWQAVLRLAPPKILVVTSAGPLSRILGQFLGLDRNAEAKLQTELWNTGVSRVMSGGQSLDLKAWNVCPHLSGSRELQSLK